MRHLAEPADRRFGRTRTVLGLDAAAPRRRLSCGCGGAPQTPGTWPVEQARWSGEDLNGLRILVVEDEAAISLLLEDMLLDFGCEVVGPAARLAAALDTVEREASTSPSST